MNKFLILAENFEYIYMIIKGVVMIYDTMKYISSLKYAIKYSGTSTWGTPDTRTTKCCHISKAWLSFWPKLDLKISLILFLTKIGIKNFPDFLFNENWTSWFYFWHILHSPKQFPWFFVLKLNSFFLFNFFLMKNSLIFFFC